MRKKELFPRVPTDGRIDGQAECVVKHDRSPIEPPPKKDPVPPADRPVLRHSRNEWDFSTVSENEKQACLLYEMARECETFWLYQQALDLRTKSLGVDIHKSAESDQFVPATPQEMEAAKKQLDALRRRTGFDLEAFERTVRECPNNRNCFFETCVKQVHYYWPLWVELPNQARTKFASDYLEGRRFTVRVPSITDVERHWKGQLARLDFFGNAPDNERELIEWTLKRLELAVEPVFQDGVMYVTLAFNLGDYTNARLREECSEWLANWLPANRPTDCPEPKIRGKGKSTEVGAALTGLACMRALAAFPFRHPIDFCII